MSSEISSFADDVVIGLRHVSKTFEMYDKPRHRLQQMLFGKFKTYYKEFKALDDINFEVKCGECVGLIGRNGAGKSTILQIITGTLQPTSGEVYIKPGLRIAALLELGSGFNPEFTGRENVFLNASILGFTEEETKKMLPQVEAFADIGEFIDQPVKTYSSGMMVRLAFSVQVMLQPDILIVDEALAVGDAMFQQKCFQRIRKLRDNGTTILFVSHSHVMIQTICNKVVYMTHGRVDSVGDTATITERYFRAAVQDNVEMEQAMRAELLTMDHNCTQLVKNGKFPFRVNPKIDAYDFDRVKNPKVEITSVDIYDNDNKQCAFCQVFDTITIAVSFQVHEDFPAGLYVGLCCKNDQNMTVFLLTMMYLNQTLPELKTGERYVATFRMKVTCIPRKYFLTTSVRGAQGEAEYFIDDITQSATLDVIPRNHDDLNRFSSGYVAVEDTKIELQKI